MTNNPPASSDEGKDRAQRITEQLSSLGLNFDASTGSVVPGEGVDVSQLPSSVALNGAANGQGRFYSSSEFQALISKCDGLTSGPAADEKKPFAESYSAREKMEKARVNIETKRCLAMLDGTTPHETLQEAQGQVARLEYRLGSIALSCEEGSLKALDHLVGGAMPYFFGGEVAGLVEKLSSGDSPAEASASLPRPLMTTLPVNEAIDLLNTAGAANANRENFKLTVELLMAAEQLYAASKDDALELTLELTLEQLHTQTLFYLAQTYGHLGDAPNSSLYCAKTTYRQLKFNLSLSGRDLETTKTTLDVVDWTRNVMTLANYYVGIGHNLQAEHCLQVRMSVDAAHLLAMSNVTSTLPFATPFAHRRPPATSRLSSTRRGLPPALMKTPCARSWRRWIGSGPTPILTCFAFAPRHSSTGRRECSRETRTMATLP